MMTLWSNGIAMSILEVLLRMEETCKYKSDRHWSRIAEKVAVLRGWSNIVHYDKVSGWCFALERNGFVYVESVPNDCGEDRIRGYVRLSEKGRAKAEAALVMKTLAES